MTVAFETRQYSTGLRSLLVPEIKIKVPNLYIPCSQETHSSILILLFASLSHFSQVSRNIWQVPFKGKPAVIKTCIRANMAYCWATKTTYGNHRKVDILLYLFESNFQMFPANNLTKCLKCSSLNQASDNAECSIG